MPLTTQNRKYMDVETSTNDIVFNNTILIALIIHILIQELNNRYNTERKHLFLLAGVPV